MDSDKKKECSFSIADIFNRYLNELGINEFPYNGDKWRNKLRWESDMFEQKDECSADLYTVERLLDLSSQKPFVKEIDWSPDMKTFLSKAIKYPNKINMDNIHQVFKCLKMIDRHIENVDEYITKFKNLEELVLSANQIKTINMKLLPRQLKVLELCGNNLNENIGCMCKSPPPKINYIGLSYNNILDLSKFIHPHKNCWDSLLSLDLSFNNFQDLFKLVDVLQKLPKLHNLGLIGNPLYMFPGYRGYVIDSLPTLTFLDEVNISANEKHLFKGMNRLKSLPTSNFCLVELKLDNFKGKIKQPADVNMEEIITTFIKYHVEFTFIHDCTIIDYDDLYTHEPDGDNIPIIPECCDTDESNYLNQVIKSNEFSFLDDQIKFKLNKYIICKSLESLTEMLRNKIEVRFIQIDITMSNGPIDNELVPEVKDLSVTNKVRKQSVAMKELKRNNSGKSVLSNSKKNVVKTAKPKKSKINVDELNELTRTTGLSASVMIDCQPIIEGSSNVQQECIFVPIHVTKPEIEPEADTSNEKPKKKVGKAASKPNAKREKVETIPEDEEREIESQETYEPPSVKFYFNVIQWRNSKEAFEWIRRFGTKALK